MNPLSINTYRYAEPCTCKIGDTEGLYIRITKDSDLVYGMDYRDFRRLDSRIIIISDWFASYEYIIKSEAYIDTEDD